MQSFCDTHDDTCCNGMHYNGDDHYTNQNESNKYGSECQRVHVLSRFIKMTKVKMFVIWRVMVWWIILQKHNKTYNEQENF